MPEGFLAVSSHPSTSLAPSEYHAWYEEEHITIRLNRLRSFLSGARYQAIDLEQLNSEEQGLVKPSWLAMYEIDSPDTFGDPSYTSLREKRSEREKNVMSRLDVLVRRTGELIGVWGEPEGERNTGMKVGRPSGWVITHVFDFDAENGAQPGERDELVTKWASKVKEKLRKENSPWVRVRVVRVLESGKAKMGVATDLDEDERGDYFVVHEFGDEKAPRSHEFRTALTTTESLLQEKGRVHIRDWRIWKLYKAYPCIAQENV